MKTMICLVLDRSGSMGGRETDVVGGVNRFIEDQKALPDPATVAMVRFDSQAIERFRPMQNLAEFKPLEASEYQPRGGTPLLDALGKTLIELDSDWAKERPERAILVVVTDGQENESHEYTKARIKDMIESRQKSGLWAIIYLGADVDAFAEAGSMGINLANAAGYTKSAAGVAKAYSSTSYAVASMRSSGHMSASNLGVANLGEDDAQAAPAPFQQQVQGASAWVPPVAGQAAGTAWTPPSAA